MRSRSLLILGSVFMCAFAGRAAVFAESLGEGPGGAAASGPPQPKTCINGAIAETLQAGLKDLDARRAALAEKEQALKIFSGRIEQRLAELEALNQSVAAGAEKIQSRRQEEARRVGAIYEQMKPQLAGPIIAGMDPEFAADLLLSMNGESASAIMATLDAKRAYAITVLMAKGAQFK